jgi:novel protein kinase C delta type
LIQTKPSFYPNWNSCFDCHLYEGRMIQIVIKVTHSDEWMAEATVSAEYLASKARKRLIQQDWVSRRKGKKINTALANRN